MVILTLLVAVIGAGIWVRLDWQIRNLRILAEDWEARYLGMASDNVDLRIQLQDAKESYSRLIGQRAMGWAGEELRIH